MEIDPAMWLNSVRAVPAIGIKFRSTFDTPATLISRIKPLLSKWQSEFSTLKMAIEKDFAVKVERSDGVEIKLMHDQLTVRFYYLSKLVERGHEQGVVRFDSERRSFEDLCGLVQGVLSEVLAELSKDGNRKIVWIGVVADGNLDPDSLPPGFDAYLKHMASPWKLGVASSKSTVLARIAETEEVQDRCHHMLDVPIADEDDSVLTFKLDWQRLYKEPEAFASPKLRGEVAAAVQSAMSYFGTFGIGDLTYADDK